MAFAQWNAARRLVERVAKVTMNAGAALGIREALEPELDRITDGKLAAALWHACRGGEREMAAMLLARGADREWVAPWDHTTPLDAAIRQGAHDVAEWLRTEGARSGPRLGGVGKAT